jgi:hypothetical protein
MMNVIAFVIVAVISGICRHGDNHSRLFKSSSLVSVSIGDLANIPGIIRTRYGSYEGYIGKIAAKL